VCVCVCVFLTAHVNSVNENNGSFTLVKYEAKSFFSSLNYVSSRLITLLKVVDSLYK
jgi:hypothetical protein